MNLELVELTPNVIGKKLGLKLYNTKGLMLIGEGAEINQFQYSHLQEFGYRSVYLQKNNSDNSETGGYVISESMRAKSPATLKYIFKKLMSKRKIEILEAKKELDSLAESLVRNVDFKRQSAPLILDLKRQNDYLYQHSINVAAYSILIGQSLQYHRSELLYLSLTALLHDIGMMEIDSLILYKESELTESECEKIKEHTIKGFQHLNRNCNYSGLVTIGTIQHHERFNGSGYPKSLCGNAIHEYARIIALSDFFDAYTSDRPYRRLHTIDEAIDYIKMNDGIEFDPKIVSKFLSFFE